MCVSTKQNKMTSIIPTEICDNCCETCIKALHNVCCMVDYDECLDWACDAGSEQGGYTGFKNTCIRADTSSALRDVADADVQLYRHQIMQNLFGATIVNKCKSCFLALCDHTSDDDIELSLCLPTGFVVDMKTCVPLHESDICSLTSSDELSDKVKQSVLSNLLLIYYDASIFEHALQRFLPIQVKTWRASMKPDEWDHHLATAVRVVVSNYAWKSMLDHNPQAFETLLFNIRLYYEVHIDLSMVCQYWLFGAKTSGHDLMNRDLISYCKAQVDQGIYIAYITEAKANMEYYMSAIENKEWHTQCRDRCIELLNE